jgi:hypothetical protein
MVPFQKRLQIYGKICFDKTHALKLITAFLIFGMIFPELTANTVFEPDFSTNKTPGI